MLRQVVGVCGLNGAGKSTLCNWYASQGWTVVSLSDILRQELKNQAETRTSLIDIGNQLRNAEGAACLATRTIAQLDDNTNYVIDSIRHPAEVEELRTLDGITIVAIVADSEIRYERLKARGRVGDVSTVEEFTAAEEAELANPDPLGQQLAKTIEVADLTLENNYGTTEEFEAAIVALCEDGKLPKPTSLDN